MKKIIKKVKTFINVINHLDETKNWMYRDYLGHPPQFIKEKILLKYSIKDAPWIETGTYLGETTQFLIKRFPMVHTIEPEPKLYENAYLKFKNKNVEVYNDISENIFPQIIEKIDGNLNLWLDGHYSEGITFKGPQDCPIIEELNAISKNLHRFTNISIFIDDYRCFSSEKIQTYPHINYIVDWANSNKFKWHIMHDIIILRK